MTLKEDERLMKKVIAVSIFQAQQHLEKADKYLKILWKDKEYK